MAKHLQSTGSTRGKPNPCVYFNKQMNCKTLVHGVDYAAVRSLSGLRWLQTQPESAADVKTVIAKIPHRAIRASHDGCEYECD